MHKTGGLLPDGLYSVGRWLMILLRILLLSSWCISLILRQMYQGYPVPARPQHQKSQRKLWIHKWLIIRVEYRVFWIQLNYEYILQIKKNTYFCSVMNNDILLEQVSRYLTLRMPVFLFLVKWYTINGLWLLIISNLYWFWDLIYILTVYICFTDFIQFFCSVFIVYILRYINMLSIEYKYW